MDIGIITFQLGGMNFCVYADRILEIIQYNGVRKIPRPLPYIVGLMRLRKHIVVVVDLRKRLGLSPISLSKDTVMIVVNLSSGITGILVDAISDFKRIQEEKIVPPIPIAGFPESLLNGIFAEEGDIMLIPNLSKIFSSYLNIRLVPISPSEKIAFRYRFTAGALTRTLEDNLLNQCYLDYEVVRKLPQSLCLPSVSVHKITSYHPDFQPRKPLGKEQRWILSQTLRAGDEKYASLSQQLLSQPKQGIHEGKTEKNRQDSRKHLVESLVLDSHVPVSKLLEEMLHTIENFHEPLTIDDWRLLGGVFHQQPAFNKVPTTRTTNILPIMLSCHPQDVLIVKRIANPLKSPLNRIQGRTLKNGCTNCSPEIVLRQIQHRPIPVCYEHYNRFIMVNMCLHSNRLKKYVPRIRYLRRNLPNYPHFSRSIPLR